jgi:hypothetical protein
MIHWETKYHRFCTVPVDELLPYIRIAFGGTLDVLGHEVNVDSSRIELFCAKALVCKTCGLRATHWAVEVPHKRLGTQRPHLNLYGTRPDGTEEQFTQDHIVPRHTGGATNLHNLQVMCWTCNQAKAVLERR